MAERDALRYSTLKKELTYVHRRDRQTDPDLTA
jgi:hypothetical protein